MRYLDLADFLIIAGAALDLDPDVLAKASDLHLAESALMAPSAEFGGVEFYPEFEMKVSVLGWHIIRNHPLPDGNKRAGFLAMIEFVERNGRNWTSPLGDDATETADTVATIEGVAADKVSVNELRDWVIEHMALEQQ